MTTVDRAAEELSTLIESPQFATLATGAALLPPQLIETFGVSGPAARASGVDCDLRRSEPYLGYAELASLISNQTSRSAGDAQARFVQLAEEVLTSTALVRACVRRLRRSRGR